MWSMEQTNLVLLFKLFTVLAVVILLFRVPSEAGVLPLPCIPYQQMMRFSFGSGEEASML